MAHTIYLVWDGWYDDVYVTGAYETLDAAKAVVLGNAIYGGKWYVYEPGGLDGVQVPDIALVGWKEWGDRTREWRLTFNGLNSVHGGWITETTLHDEEKPPGGSGVSRS